MAFRKFCVNNLRILLNHIWISTTVDSTEKNEKGVQHRRLSIVHTLKLHYLFHKKNDIFFIYGKHFFLGRKMHAPWERVERLKETTAREMSATSLELSQLRWMTMSSGREASLRLPRRWLGFWAKIAIVHQPNGLLHQMFWWSLFGQLCIRTCQPKFMEFILLFSRWNTEKFGESV